MCVLDLRICAMKTDISHDCILFPIYSVGILSEDVDIFKIKTP